MYDHEKLLLEGRLEKASHYIQSLETKSCEMRKPQEYLEDMSML